MRSILPVFTLSLALAGAACSTHEGGLACTPGDTDAPVVGAIHDVAPSAEQAAGRLDSPALARGGGAQLAVWRYGERLLAARLDTAGKAQEAPWVVGDADGSGEPALVWGGDGFLVVSVEAGAAFRVTPVSADGEVGTPGAAFAADAAAADPRLASNGTVSLLVWSSNATVYAARLGADGAFLDAAPLRIAEHATSPAVVWDGGQFVIVWQSEAFPSTMRGARLGAGGDVLDPAGVDLPEGWSASLAAGDQGAVLAYVTAEGTRAMRLGADLAPLDAAPSVVGVPPLEESEGSLHIARAASGLYVVSWEVTDDTMTTTPYAQALDASLTRIGAPFAGAYGDSGPAALIGLEGSDFLAILGDSARRLTSTASAVEAGPSQAVSASFAPQATPAAAGSGEDHLVVWGEEVADGSKHRLRGRFVGLDGAPSSAAAFDIGADDSFSGTARVGWSGARYVVAAKRIGGGAEIAVIAPEGGVEATHALSATPVVAVGLACAESRCFAAWSQRSGGGDELRGSFLGEDGSLLTPGGAHLLDSPLPSMTDELVVLPLGNDIGLFWKNRGARVNAAGTSAALIAGFSLEGSDLRYVVAAGPDTVLAAHRTNPYSASQADRVEVLRFDGTLVASVDNHADLLDAAAWDGAGYLVATRSTLQVITRAGVVAASADLGETHDTALASGAAGQTLVVGTTRGDDGTDHAQSRTVQRGLCQ